MISHDNMNAIKLMLGVIFSHPYWYVVDSRYCEVGRPRQTTTGKPKTKIYGEAGTVSRAIIKIINKHFEEDHNFFPWLHNRLRLFKETDLEFSYL